LRVIDGQDGTAEAREQAAEQDRLHPHGHRPDAQRAGNFRGGRISRVLFCLHSSRMVLLHAFIKKTQKTPDSDLDLALKRMKEIT
jgi:hypothetical protein